MTHSANAVFISGGGSGIGRYLARHYASRGLPVAVFDLAIAESVRGELTRLPGSTAFSFHEVDVCDAAGLEAAAIAAVDAVGVPRLAINCAARWSTP